jgi:hypothetical protein
MAGGGQGAGLRMSAMSPPLRCHPPRKRGIHAMPRAGIGSNKALDLRLRGDDEALHTPLQILCKGAQVCPLPWRKGVRGRGKRQIGEAGMAELG